MNTAILYDGHAEGWSEEDVRQVREVVARIEDILVRSGHTVTPVPARPDLAWIDGCRGADLVVNLCEGIGGISQYEPMVVGTLELLGTPFTGARARTIAHCHDKHLVNAVLDAAGLPVPPWCLESTPAGRVELPAIVKPAAEDASVGIDQRSVVTTREEMHARIAALRGEFDDVLIQHYVGGREFAVGFLGAETLPLSEIDFSDMPDGAWPILTFDAKWSGGGPEDVGSRPVCPAAVDGALATAIRDVAASAWQAVAGSSYGRVDLRVDDAGTPWIIEVNPNPDISADAGLARMARAAGRSYDDLVLEIADLALRAGSASPGGWEAHAPREAARPTRGAV